MSGNGVIITTSYQVAERGIRREIGIISAECAFGMNIFRDMLAGVRDIVGGRSGSVQKLLREARETVLADLAAEAAEIGADAVIAVDLDYHELTGGGKAGMLLVVATGTAVELS